ncbi:MAG: cysteine--tRNA ligase, partial [Nanoarchaeota archaeon]|nr:cysteine--tRNA ligase [Nanoarchaeota archaeon]
MLKLYNTLTRKKEIFRPIKKGNVGLYTCGPTVYDFAHIGNFRAYMGSDILRRYLEYKGYKVKHVMNLTDVDDKTIKASQSLNIKLDDYTKKYKKAFFDDIDTLNIKRADIFPEATKHIKEMVALIKTLLKKGYAYKGDDGSIYYDISKFKDYDKLSRIKIKELKAGARVSQDEYEKDNASDFALWKAWDNDDKDVFWETELGKGRPGWHIECSVMSMKYLGNHFDIHTGGIDLIFPHHSNEIAQSEAATGEKFVNYWFHNEYILVDEKKMSKSSGNFFTLRDLVKKGYDSRAIRYALLSTHYKVPLNFTFKGLDSAKNSIERFDNFILKLQNEKSKKDNKNIDKLIKEVKVKFEKEMDDDLNISNALAAVFGFMNKINKEKISKKDAEKIVDLMKDFDKVFGILKTEKEKISKDIKELIQKREEARKNKD